MVGVADCERVQTNWFRARAAAVGGTVWDDSGMLWVDGPDGINLMFPEAIDPESLRRGVSHARESGRSPVGAWLGLDVDTAALSAAGFDRGWSPWWMVADLDDVPRAADARVRLERDSEDYSGQYAAYREVLALARVAPTRAWYAAARTGPDGEFAGRAWAFLDGDVAGIFDMDVWPRFQRRGIGTGLLSAVCAPARDAGARWSVLNATPEGKELYSARGFTQIGEGITWWCHLRR